jgi:hypothetical protein
MATRTPLNRLTFCPASVADDLGYVALSDLARMLGSVTDDYRVGCRGRVPPATPVTAKYLK